MEQPGNKALNGKQIGKLNIYMKRRQILREASFITPRCLSVLFII